MSNTTFSKRDTFGILRKSGGCFGKRKPGQHMFVASRRIGQPSQQKRFGQQIPVHIDQITCTINRTQHQGHLCKAHTKRKAYNMDTVRLSFSTRLFRTWTCRHTGVHISSLPYHRCHITQKKYCLIQPCMDDVTNDSVDPYIHFSFPIASHPAAGVCRRLSFADEKH